MQEHQHFLLSPASGTQRVIHSLHYGLAQTDKKVYLQAGLHADEIPGVLVLHYLRKLLATAEQDLAIVGKVVLVPVANPIGLDQTFMYTPIGRFEQGSMQNFNRHYPDFFTAVKDTVATSLTQDPHQNKKTIRLAMYQWLANQKPQTELEALRKTLVELAYDADVVIDLHCDFEAIPHAYVEKAYLPQSEDFTRYMQSQTILWANSDNQSHHYSFDEALSRLWHLLAKHFGTRFPIPLSCFATTLELRGQTDVNQALAQADAHKIFSYLQHLGMITGTPPSMPKPKSQATPLAGVTPVSAPHPGVISFEKELGTLLKAEDVIAQVIEPLTQKVSIIKTAVPGVLYARTKARWASLGMELARVAGTKPRNTRDVLVP
jgi:predicted deacylase